MPPSSPPLSSVDLLCIVDLPSKVVDIPLSNTELVDLVVAATLSNVELPWLGKRSIYRSIPLNKLCVKTGLHKTFYLFCPVQ